MLVSWLISRLTFFQGALLTLTPSLLPNNDVVLIPESKQQQQQRVVVPHKDAFPEKIIQFPLKECFGGSQCVQVQVQDRVFRAAVDTGSPYLVLSDRDMILPEGAHVPSATSSNNNNNNNNGGKKNPLRLLNDFPESGFPPTEEIYGLNYGLLFWKKIPPNGVSFLQAKQQSSSSFNDFPDSGYPPTEENYGRSSGLLSWKEIPPKGVSFSHHHQPSNNNNNNRVTTMPQSTIVGLMDERLSKEAGGSLLGLVAHPNPPRQLQDYRPTWLEQFRFDNNDDDDDDDITMTTTTKNRENNKGCKVQSFSIDRDFLTLSNKSLLDKNDNHIPLFKLEDLRPLGEFIEHYTFRVSEIDFDGVVVNSATLGGRPIMAVLDTGLTGCLLSEPFYNDLVCRVDIDPRRAKQMTVSARGINNKNNKRKDNKKQQKIDFKSGRQSVNKSLFYVSKVYMDYFYNEKAAPHMIVLGQCFLNQGRITIDVERRLASFEPLPTPSASLSS